MFQGLRARIQWEGLWVHAISKLSEADSSWMLRLAHRSQRVSASGFKCHYYSQHSVVARNAQAQKKGPVDLVSPTYLPIYMQYTYTYIHHLGCAHGIPTTCAMET